MLDKLEGFWVVGFVAPRRHETCRRSSVNDERPSRWKPDQSTLLAKSEDESGLWSASTGAYHANILLHPDEGLVGARRIDKDARLVRIVRDLQIALEKLDDPVALYLLKNSTQRDSTQSIGQDFLRFEQQRQALNLTSSHLVLFRCRNTALFTIDQLDIDRDGFDQVCLRYETS